VGARCLRGRWGGGTVNEPNTAKHPTPVEVAFDDGSSVILRSGSCFVQRRAGALTVESLDLMSALWRTLKRVPGPHIVALFMIGEAAELSEREVRARQRVLLDDIFNDPRFIGAAVIEGHGVGSSLKRTLARAVGRGRAQVFADERPAARALGILAGGDVERVLLLLAAEARRRERR
jgi:hypothetical protein